MYTYNLFKPKLSHCRESLELHNIELTHIKNPNQVSENQLLDMDLDRRLQKYGHKSNNDCFMLSHPSNNTLIKYPGRNMMRPARNMN